MGWTFLDRVPHGGMKAFLDREYGSAILRSEVVGDTYYAAGRLTDGRVIALVTLIDGAGWKTMDESEGPYRTDCPAAILDMLTDPPPNEYARNWREACRATLAARSPA